VTRHCANPSCRAVLAQRPGEQLRNFLARQTCNRACDTARKYPRPENPLLTMPELPVLAGQPLSHEVIGDLLGMTRTAVQHHEQKALEKLRALVSSGWRKSA
jgi:hypothetical protein